MGFPVNVSLLITPMDLPPPRIFTTLSVTALLLSAILPLRAVEVFEPLRTDVPPVIDGVLDEEIWKRSRGFTDFKTYIPDFEKPQREPTVAFIAYDSEHVYFAFRCYDSEPEKIKTSVSARDRIRPDDWVCVNLDSNNDQQVLYTFYVNPDGIQMDARHVGPTGDEGVDLVWESAGSMDEEGYSVEMAIPFKSLRYSRSEPVRMGVILERRISRYSSQATYPPLDPDRGFDFLIDNMKLSFHDIEHYTLYEVLPAVTYSNRKIHEGGTFRTDRDRGEVSLTGKVGLSSDLILDGTYNPDFSQVEADAGQVEENQRFALFFSEKRPFFLEGNELYAIAGRSNSDPLRTIVHTRQIVNPGAGVKLAGKAGRRNHLAVLYALDEPPDDIPGGTAPDAHCTVVRYKRSFRDDDYLGAFYTGREAEDDHNRLAGADGKIRLGKASTIGWHGMASVTKDSTGEDSYPRHAAGVTCEYGTRTTEIQLGIHDISEGFTTRVGYVTRTGITRARMSWSPMFYPPEGFVKKIAPVLSGIVTRDKPSGLTEHEVSPGVHLVMLRDTGVSARYLFSSEVFGNREFSTDGVVLEVFSQVLKQLSVNLEYFGGKKIRYIEEPYQARGNTFGLTTIFQPTEHFSTELSCTYSDLFRDDGGERVFDYTIVRSRNTYQVNRYLFLRAILEHDSFDGELTTDFLVSFTYIPGTVLHVGYGSLYEKARWDGREYVEDGTFHEMRRGFFFKASYLWRL